MYVLSFAATYQLINIHQRTKTAFAVPWVGTGISLSISIREPKLSSMWGESADRISLSISIREPKHDENHIPHGAVSAYQYPSENQNLGAAGT